VSESNAVTPEIEAVIPPPPPIEAGPPLPAPAQLPIDFQGRRVRPLLGPGLWIFGMLLWAQVVFGVFVVAKNMPEPYALTAVLLVVALGWVLAVRQRQDARKLAFRHFAPLIVALSFWAGALLFALLFAAVTGAGEAMGFLLVPLAITALFVGRRFAGPPRQAATLPRKALIGLVWIITAFTTFAAALMLSDA
jgi:hypothetical protein